MSSVFEYERDAVRVKARYVVPNTDEEIARKFSVDPNLTSYETLRALLSRAFDLPQDAFKLFYQYVDDEWFPMLSDWDLDAAIVSASEPWLQLELMSHRISTSSEAESEACSPPLVVPPKEEELPLLGGSEDERRTSSAASFLPSPETIQSIVTTSNKASISFFNQTIPTLTRRLHKAFKMPDEKGSSNSPSPTKLLRSPPPSTPAKSAGRPPLSDKEFRSFLDNVGELTMPKELRVAIYQGGVEPQLRKVVWKHLLGLYPIRMSGKDRMTYMKQKSAQYESLRHDWTALIVQGKISCSSDKAAEELRNITNMVRKDVLRTDRHHPFYAGEGNVNVTALFNILTTYALNHQSVGYCQGMSDLLSPLLVTMMEESHAYVAFCGLMERLKCNFMVDGISMTKKFQHLSDGLMHYDPEFYTYLKVNQANDLLFCYRWLLLEMKREFRFEDSLKVLEVLWSSLPPSNPDEKCGLPLFETRFCSKINTAEKALEQQKIANATSKRLTAYSKVASLRRQVSTSVSRTDSQKRRLERIAEVKGKQKLDDRPRIKSVGSSSPASTKLVKSRSCKSDGGFSASSNSNQINGTAAKSARKITDFKDFHRLTTTSSRNDDEQAKKSGRVRRADGEKTDRKAAANEVSEDDLGIDVEDESSKSSRRQSLNLDDDDGTVAYSQFNAASASSGSSPNHLFTLVSEKLPEPIEFGDRNPFLMFLCIACLLQHRDHIMKQGYDSQEIAMHFDRMVRKHEAEKTLSSARRLFADYLNDDISSSTTFADNVKQSSPSKRNATSVANGKANC